MGSVEELDALLSRPGGGLVADLAQVAGDILVLGAGGKMGPTLARLARRAAADKRVVAVARFTTSGLREELERDGIETIAADLLDREALRALPLLPNVVFMAGHKFGASGDPALTWALNVHLPALVAEHFSRARIVAFSTGCVYPFVAPASGGSTETTPVGAAGDYAMSCIGRERMFQHFSRRHGTPGRLVRLNYAVEMRYGVLHDIARAVRDGAPVDVTMGHVNVIWQGDAASQALRCLRHCAVPTAALNVSGPETISVRWLAAEFARRLGREARFAGEEAPACWLTNAAEAARLFGYPEVPLGVMLDWVADWVAADRPSLNKPTKFEVRSGAF
ncbi:MAG: NAD-dependent epimerase/dehydratase family protein [Alphaproteobacteria bacterium]|nr:NAD-dependent epimerase/dehydratase family protein [Alphaproteobacteria bacterium]